jgi:hypothetical protein
MNLDTAVSEILRTIFDRAWHPIYEMHTKFRLSSFEIYESVVVLEELGIVERRDMDIRLSVNLNDRHLSIMNKLSKTYRPEKLNVYRPEKPLTTRNNRVL